MCIRDRINSAWYECVMMRAYFRCVGLNWWGWEAWGHRNSLTQHASWPHIFLGTHRILLKYFSFECFCPMKICFFWNDFAPWRCISGKFISSEYTFPRYIFLGFGALACPTRRCFFCWGNKKKRGDGFIHTGIGTLEFFCATKRFSWLATTFSFMP